MYVLIKNYKITTIQLYISMIWINDIAFSFNTFQQTILKLIATLFA
jgi:hypothetical protein